MTKPYSYIDAVEFKDSIVVWGRDMTGELITEKFPLSDYLYAYIKDNTGAATMKDLWGNLMKKVSFEDKWDFRDWCKTRTGISESDVPPVYKMLLDVFSDAPTDAPYNTLLYDIEVDFDLDEGRGYPTPKNPYGEINLFQAFDVHRQRYVLFMNDKLNGVVHLSDETYPVEVHYVTDERDLLASVADYIQHVDIMCGWYTNGFDLPYIMERTIMLFGEKTAKSMFCRDGFLAKRREFVNDFGDEVWEWTLVGRQHLDMMELYKKFIPGEKTSFSLNAVAESDLGETKDEYDGDLGTLYRENPQAFCNYGLQDVRLLNKLDEKHQIVRLAVSISRGSCVFMKDVTGSVKVIEHDLMKFCHKRGIVLPDRNVHEKEKYPGAVVYDTIPGRHGWIASYDLRSLYPFCMILLGLSPETMLMQCLGEYDDYVAIMQRDDTRGEIDVEIISTGEIIKCLPSEMESLIRDNGYTISGNATVFNGKLGILAEYVSEGFALRSHYKKLMKEAHKSGDLASVELYDLYQKVVKVARLNAVYGASGNESFRLFSLRLAKSITLTAQVVSKHQAFTVDRVSKSLAAKLK